MRICQLVASLDERHGGPSKSVYALCRGLADLGHEVDLFTLNTSDTEIRDEGRLRVRAYRREHPQFLARSSALWRELTKTPCDVVHNHALWLRPLHYARRLAEMRGVPLVNSPRGMMSRWAWNHHKLRKRFARFFVHPRALSRTTAWHATSEEEATEIRSLGFRQPVGIAPNGVDAPSEDARREASAYWRKVCRQVNSQPTAVFYSRFHRKKRVLELIDLWLEHAPHEWLLLMVGVPEDYTPAELETYVMRSSGAGRVRAYRGEGCPPPYAVASLFLLPSHNENFGLVIAEAMAHAVPVLVTDTTPWSAVNSLGCGWCASWENYGATLAAALAETPAQRSSRGALARDWVLREFSWQQAARKLETFYGQILPQLASTVRSSAQT